MYTAGGSPCQGGDGPELWDCLTRVRPILEEKWLGRWRLRFAAHLAVYSTNFVAQDLYNSYGFKEAFAYPYFTQQ